MIYDTVCSASKSSDAMKHDIINLLGFVPLLQFNNYDIAVVAAVCTGNHKVNPL